jgi:carbamoyl-phosphate synthase large subunit
VTKTTKACFEPALDYVVVKIPRWPFDKFTSGDRTLFTQMKATGEVMAIDRTFESALLKAVRGLEVRQKDLKHAGMSALADDALRQAIRIPTDERLWAIAEGLRRGWSVAEVAGLCRVDAWFLNKLKTLIESESAAPKKGKQCYKMIDTCAAEFESKTPYYYATDDEESDTLGDVGELRIQ